MALKVFLKDIEGLSDDLKSEYVKKDDGYHLKIDGYDPEEAKKQKAKVDEFRDNNIKLAKQVEDLTKKLEVSKYSHIHAVSISNNKLKQE